MEDHESPSSEYYADDLTWREQDILNLLAERLSNREIAEQLFLAESTVKDYVGKILKKLYVENRRQAVERARELGILGHDTVNAPTPKLNLPSAPTPFIGRTSELEQIKQQLGKTRLLTLTGPGGMGKTRLALKTAEDTVDDFQDGCFFVSLAPIHSVDHIIQSIAEAVDFPLPTHEDPKYQLLRYLQKKNLLLVMDNFEHLMDGASIVSEILQSTSRVKVLATSRERLNLKSETAVSIAGMDEANHDAVTLFLQSGAKAQPGFEPLPDETIQIENICRFVGGMPLAIELAASWLHVLSVKEVFDEMKKSLDILETEVRDAPERHRSIRAVFDQSWSLLEESEQEIFMRLSIFRGGFTREAAQQVAGASLKHISGLIKKSILKHDPHSGRLDIHELLRQYAQEQLERAPQTDKSTKEAYAAYYADFMQEKWDQIRSPKHIPAVAETVADIENVRAAWRYYLDEQNASQLRKFIHAFMMVYWIQGWLRGAIELFSDGVEALVPTERDADVQAIQAAIMGHLGFFMTFVGLADEGYKQTKESIEILERFEYPIDLAHAYHSLTLAAYYLDRPAEEKKAALRYLELAEASKDKWLSAYGLWLVSLAEFREKNYIESKRYVEASLELSNEIENTISLALCYTSFGGLAIHYRDFADAKKYFTRCFQLSKKLGFRWLSSNAIKYLGQIALSTGDLGEAHKHLTQSLRIAYDLGLDRDIANHLYNFASLRVAQDKLEEGVELLSLLLQQPVSHQARSGGGSIRDRAKGLLADLENRLSEEIYIAAMKRGELLEIDEVVVELVGPKLGD